MDALQLAALIAGGFICGIVNAAAGGGSFVTLPLLMWLGLPPQVANATNRVAIVLQCAAGIATYQGHNVRPWRHLWRIAPIAIVGSICGALLASRIDESSFRYAAAVLFVIMIVTVFLNPSRWARKESVERIKAIHYPLFFVIGLYGGFLQAGVGVLMLSTFVLLAGFDVVRANALKFGLAISFTSVALLLFAQAGQVRWLPGLALAIGTISGGAVGARLVVLKGSGFVRIIVVVAGVAAIVKLLGG